MNGPDAQRYTEDMIKGWKDPAPYPFVLAGVTPSLGTEHLIVPAGAGHLGVFSLASGLMVHSFNLPGVGNDDIAAMTTLRNPNPTGEVSSAFVPTKGAAGGVGASVRALLAVATSSYKGVRIYALDEGAAQVARVMDTRAEVARMIGPPDRKKKKKKAGAVKEGVDGEGGWIHPRTTLGMNPIPRILRPRTPPRTPPRTLTPTRTRTRTRTPRRLHRTETS